MIIDLRSDTVTRPSPDMYRAMAECELGDDVFGDDPTVHELERTGAEMMGKEAGLLLPSGTMANQVAVRTHCRPGDEVILHEGAHMYRFEQGGLAALHGVQAVPLPGEGGLPRLEAMEGAIRPDDPHFPRSTLVALENTHNLGGGLVIDGEAIAAVGAFARENGLAFHLDGARFLNAVVALGGDAATLAAPVDSLTLCLSKGLGAPVGTLLFGSADFIARARRNRKVLGGGMRQAGILAAAGLVALEEGPGNLAEDHRRAGVLAEALAALPGLDVITPQTNIVVVSLPGRDVASVLASLKRHGVLAVPFGAGRLRFTCHRDVDDDDLQRAVAAIGAALNEDPE